jgi:hypothetical protein
MAELSQKDQFALHEFSVRYRAALAKKHPAPEQSPDTVRDAVREQYEQEQVAKRSLTIGPSESTPEREPDEPDQEH